MRVQILEARLVNKFYQDIAVWFWAAIHSVLFHNRLPMLPASYIWLFFPNERHEGSIHLLRAWRAVRGRSGVQGIEHARSTASLATLFMHITGSSNSRCSLQYVAKVQVMFAAKEVANCAQF